MYLKKEKFKQLTPEQELAYLRSIPLLMNIYELENDREITSKLFKKKEVKDKC